MLTILEYIWVNNPQVILQLVEMDKISAKVFTTFSEKTIEDEVENPYTRLMRHDRWRRVRGGVIRQLHSI